jgi:hypothetical protein
VVGAGLGLTGVVEETVREPVGETAEEVVGGG